MRLINWELASNPLNWISVWIMVLLLIFVLTILEQGSQANDNTTDSIA